MGVLNSEHDPRYQTLGVEIEYSSGQSFFNKMKSNHWDPWAEDVRATVPVQNAANERAWEAIEQWDARKSSEHLMPGFSY